ncbi:hypothetical protein V8E36_002425 [Tilletia maclaganii]
MPVSSTSAAVSKAWNFLNPHLPEHLDLGPNQHSTAWFRTNPLIQARLTATQDESQAAFEVQFRPDAETAGVDAIVKAGLKLKCAVHVERNEAWLRTHKAGLGASLRDPAPEVKVYPERLVQPFQIPVLVNLTSARSIQVSISEEADNYWINIARFTFYFGAEARRSHLRWEPIAHMHQRMSSSSSPERESLFEAGNRKLKRGLKSLFGAPPGAGLGPRHAPERFEDADGEGSESSGGAPLHPHASTAAQRLHRRESVWSERTYTSSVAA